MKAVTAVVVVLFGLLLAGCASEERDQPSVVGASEQARSPRLVPGESDPCGLLDEFQRDHLGLRDGKRVEDVQLKGADFCGWQAREFNGGTYQGAVLPNNHTLANIRRGYELPQDYTVAGRPAVSGSIGGLSGELSCYVFAELPDGRLADASFWAARDEGMTHTIACERATRVLERIVETVQSR
ncbi:hypothetical protein PSU4_45480 [Pseudonocardia sulfidoxydans NBRC 16205]|uniref:DUF3558 domain-containing protein n=1 Tax=Pseudonocardia sulfidoxydans NBRC 16205 TaxID=1223511 RepID=A0A511DP65_9PSEU|nr:DUF3558 domain-containing protein [Pseudonocardia sulfidoxydans]GEL25594.1 hypothetical protein PSU4_45480 [Pseudonocardia sulfidoxydans NBRC 16205]